jgi:phosphoglucomutase/phosphomannomutase
VGFKWIAQEIDASGPDGFVFGAEESHGYLAGTHVRDKDAAVACLLMAELAAACQAEGKSLHEKLESLYWQHGYHGERLLNMTMQGSAGMARMQALMANFRSDPPQALAGIKVAGVRDYAALTNTKVGGKSQPLDSTKADMVVLDLAEEGNYIAVRPSGTEPKVKFYMFTYVPAEQLHDLDATKADMEARMAAFEKDLAAYAEKV